MRRALFDPNFSPNFEDAKIILNNMKYLSDVRMQAKVLFQQLHAHDILRGYGIMYQDHPLENLNLNDVEKLFIEHPHVIEQISDLKASDFNFDNVPTPSVEGLTKNKFNWKPFLPTLLVSVAASLISIDLGFDPNFVALSPIFSAVLFTVLDSPYYLNGALTRSILWAKAKVEYSLPPLKLREQRHAAAVLIVAYFTGMPVYALDTDPSIRARRRPEYPEAPRADMVDPSIAVLEGRGKISLRDFQRTVAVHAAAIAIDLIEGRPAEVSEHLRFLMAALLERANSATYSTLKPQDFSTFILPTLLRWGILEAVMILRENQDAYQSALKVIKSGGDLGEALLAADSAFSLQNPVFKRREDRLARENAAEKLSADATDTQISYAEMINLILRAKATPTPVIEADKPHELIPGTDRIYTREELILRPNPSAEDVKELTQELMQMRIALDRDENGRVPPQTRDYVQNLAADVNHALQIFREGKSAAGSPDSEAMQQTMSDNAVSLRNDAGLSASQIPPVLQAFPLPGAYEELLVHLNLCDKVFLNIAQSFRVWWDLSGKETLHRTTGHGIRSAVNDAWRGVKNGGTSGDPVLESPRQVMHIIALRKLLMQLNPYEAFHVKNSETGVVPSSVMSALESIMSRLSHSSSNPRDSLIRHEGGAFNDLDKADAGFIEKQNAISNKIREKDHF